MLVGKESKNMNKVIDEKTRFSLESHNVWAILVSAFFIGVSWATLWTQIALLNQKTDYQINLLEAHLSEYKADFNNIQTRLGNDELIIREVQTQIGMR